MFKRKNDDEKPKRRPRGWIIFVALGLMLIGMVGILQSLSRAATPLPTATPVPTAVPVMLFQNTTTVQSYGMETTYTIQTSNGTTTTLQDDEMMAALMPAVINAVNTALEAPTSTPLP